jgi:hypothetical protein
MTRARQRRYSRRDPLSQPPPVWKWRTLPVWLALTGGIAIGWYIAAIGANFRVGDGSFYVLLVVIAGFSFGLSRIVAYYTTRWVARRRARSQEKRILKEPGSRR